MLFWALIMALLVMAVLALRRQKRKYIAAAGLAGFLIADCALGGFVYHCRLIVQRGTEEPAASAWICFEDGTEQMKLAAGDETLERLQALAFSLERQPAERQEELRELVRDGGKAVSYTHLDVYKRQVFHTGGRQRGCRQSGGIPALYGGSVGPSFTDRRKERGA